MFTGLPHSSWKSPDTNLRAVAMRGVGGDREREGRSWPTASLFRYGLWKQFFKKTSRFQASSDFSWLASAPFQHPSPSPMYMCSFVVLVSCLLAHYYLLLCNQNQARMFRVFTVRHERQTCSCVKGELSMYVYTNKMQSCIPRAGQLDISIYICVCIKTFHSPPLYSFLIHTTHPTFLHCMVRHPTGRGSKCCGLSQICGSGL